MNTKAKTEWGIISILWIAVILLSFWNVNRVVSARERQEQIVRQEQYRSFIDRHNDNYHFLLKKTEDLSQSVESLNLGLLALEERLSSLASACNLYRLIMTRPTSLAEEGGAGEIPLTITTEGSLQDFLIWLNSVSRNFNYLTVKEVEVIARDERNRPQYRVSIHYRWQLLSSEPGVSERYE